MSEGCYGRLRLFCWKVEIALTPSPSPTGRGEPDGLPLPLGEGWGEGIAPLSLGERVGVRGRCLSSPLPGERGWGVRGIDPPLPWGRRGWGEGGGCCLFASHFPSPLASPPEGRGDKTTPSLPCERGGVRGIAPSPLGERVGVRGSIALHFARLTPSPSPHGERGTRQAPSPAGRGLG